jgi:hypothetical protein
MSLFTHRGERWGGGCVFYYWVLPDNRCYKYIRDNHGFYLVYDLEYYVMNRLVKKCVWVVDNLCGPQEICTLTSQDIFKDGCRITTKINHKNE